MRNTGILPFLSPKHPCFSTRNSSSSRASWSPATPRPLRLRPLRRRFRTPATSWRRPRRATATTVAAEGTAAAVATTAEAEATTGAVATTKAARRAGVGWFFFGKGCLRLCCFDCCFCSCFVDVGFNRSR